MTASSRFRRRAEAVCALSCAAIVLLAPGACSSAPAGSAATAVNAPLGLPDAAGYEVPQEWKYRSVLAEAAVVSDGGLVATDAPLATQVGVDVLRQGGNAVDAAVATAFALAVVYPRAGNIGGGGFMVLRLADGEAAALDFRETAPQAADHDMYLDANGDVGPDSIVGHRASGVPGSVAGLWLAHERYGTMEWAQLLAPAIRLAREGFVVNGDFAAAASSKRLGQFDASRALFWPGGQPVQEGDTWSDPDLAGVLERISVDGADDFYRGETADLIVDEMERGGGLITHADLAGYEAKWREPIVFDYRGYQVISMPPPSSGGLTLALASNIVEGYDLRALGWHSPEAIHRIAEAMRRAFAERNAWVGDPDFVDVPNERFLSTEYAAELRASIAPDHATPSSEIHPEAPGPVPESMHTTHFSVADAAGNAVALTTTLNLSNGSGVTVHGGGFLLNNEMDDFASKPGSPNAYGLVQGEANAIAPGKRMTSSMTPTIVVDGGEAILVTGASGGPTIINGVFQILTNVVDYGFRIRAAVALPRFHQQHLPDRLLFESGGIPDGVLQQLRQLGHEPTPARFPIATAASLLQVDGHWTGTRDPRKLGLAAGQ